MFFNSKYGNLAKAFHGVFVGSYDWPYTDIPLGFTISVRFKFTIMSQQNSVWKCAVWWDFVLSCLMEKMSFNYLMIRAHTSVLICSVNICCTKTSLASKPKITWHGSNWL
jgi:hypothetical protein